MTKHPAHTTNQLWPPPPTRGGKTAIIRPSSSRPAGAARTACRPSSSPPSFVPNTQSARSQVFRLDFPKMLTLQVRAGVPRGGTTDGRVAHDNKAAGGIITSHVREEGQLRRRRPPAGAKNKHNGLQRIFSKTDQGFKIDSKKIGLSIQRYNHRQITDIHTTHTIVIGP